MGYPTTDQTAIAELLDDDLALARVTLMIDSTDHLDVIEAARPARERPEARVAIDLGLAYDPPRAGRVTGRVGVYRSPIAATEQARELARAVVERPGFRLVRDIALAHDGRPHWGKMHDLDHRTLTDRLPRMGDFVALRDRLDPGGVFANAYLERVLPISVRDGPATCG